MWSCVGLPTPPWPASIPSSFLLCVHVWCMYVCMRGICVYIRMCACRGPDNFRCRSRGTTYILFRQCLPLVWNLLSRLNCLARESQGSACLYPPSAGITSTGSHQLFLFWDWTHVLLFASQALYQLNHLLLKKQWALALPNTPGTIELLCLWNKALMS